MTISYFWQKWLLVVGIIIAIFGILMTFLSGTPLFDLFNRQIDPAFWGSGTSIESIRLSRSQV
jgi:tellurite resistance protein TehA-like permease